MRFVEALGSSTLVQHSRPLSDDDDGGHEDHDHVPNHHSLAGQGLAHHRLALRSGTGAVFDPRVRQPLDGSRLQGSATPFLFGPFIAISET